MSVFNLQELQNIAENLVSARVAALKALQATLAQLENVPSDLAAIKSVFDEMNTIYKELAPAKAIAESLFPELIPLFLILDKLSLLESDMGAFTAAIPAKTS